MWLALVWERHGHADAARKWFDGCEDAQFFFCRFTQLALLCLLTTKAVMGRDVRTMTGAWEIYDQCRAMDALDFCRSRTGSMPNSEAWLEVAILSPNVWADAYLAAFASAADLKLVTFDKAFRSRSGACLILG